MSARIKYPSLYADVVVHATTDGKRGSRVLCTATGAPLGFVWWSCNASSIVTWHFRTNVEPPTREDSTSGERNSERNAVQALRDVANGGHLALSLLPLDDSDDRAQRAARTTAAINARPGWGKSSPVVVDAPVVVRHVQWGDKPTDATDLTAAIAASLARHQRKP